MTPELVNDLTFLNSKRTQELSIRFGPSVSTYASPLNHFFLHALEFGSLKQFPFFVARDGRMLIREVLRLREGILRKNVTPIAYHHALMDELPEDLRGNVFYYRFKTFRQSEERRPFLLKLVTCDTAPVFGYEKTFTLNDISHEEIYRQEKDFRKFDFCYGHSIEDFTGDCFLQFQLLRFGGRRIDEPEVQRGLVQIKRVALSFRHYIEIMKMKS